MDTRLSLKYLVLVTCFIILACTVEFLNAQEKPERREGMVTYITGQNIYVRFESTQGIENGDTLYKYLEGIQQPMLIIQHHSSVSCLCSPLSQEIEFKIGDKIHAMINIDPDNRVPEEAQAEEQQQKDISQQVIETLNEQPEKAKRLQDFSGRLSISSYSNFSNVPDAENHRFRYSFSGKATNISGTGLSAETYFLFTHSVGAWDLVNENVFNALKIYNFSFQYDFNGFISIWAGRRINPRLANVGAIDGIQAEFKAGNFYSGVAAGFRPAYTDFGFSANLPEFGFYLGHSMKTNHGFSQTSLALFEQRNQSAIDRRFAYLQHTSSPVKNLNIFSSFELDLYKLEDGKKITTLYPVSLYASVNYRMSKKVSISGSYDNRKNVIYYETFRNYSEEVFHQASRQGMRFRINYRPVNFLTISGNAGTRYRKGDPQPANTFNGNISWLNLPGINGTVTLTGNILQTPYLEGAIYGSRISKELLKGKLSSMLYYRYVDFDYTNSVTVLKQHIAEFDFSWQVNKKWNMSVNLESTVQKKDIFNRIYFSLRLKI